MITQTTVRPSVWIGCLACYNEGILNGRWFPAEEAGEVTPEDLHLGPTYHDELWIFDHEGFPTGTSEMSPDTAQLWGEVFGLFAFEGVGVVGGVGRVVAG